MITLDIIRSINEGADFDGFEIADVVALMQDSVIDESASDGSFRAKVRKVFDLIISAITRAIKYIAGKIRRVVDAL